MPTKRETELLPALQEAWPAGRATGLRPWAASPSTLNGPERYVGRHLRKYVVHAPGEEEPHTLTVKPRTRYRFVFR